MEDINLLINVLEQKMPAKIGGDLRDNILTAILQGRSYDEVALEFSVGHGTVARIVEEWKKNIGVYNADAILALAKALKKLKITPCKCADGVEIHEFINSLGIKKEKMRETF
jgi:hypothetical protein